MRPGRELASFRPGEPQPWLLGPGRGFTERRVRARPPSPAPVGADPGADPVEKALRRKLV